MQSEASPLSPLSRLKILNQIQREGLNYSVNAIFRGRARLPLESPQMQQDLHPIHGVLREMQKDELRN